MSTAAAGPARHRFEPTALPEVVLVHAPLYADARGFFVETWQAERFAAAGIAARFVQDNHSRSVRRTLRGLHYQVRHAQGKLVRPIRGRIYDVAVDLRRSSPRFGRWVGVTLSDEGGEALWVPPGFAHGFLALSETADVHYKCTDVYWPEHERVLRWDDPALAIAWPLAPGEEPLLAPRDAAGQALAGAETYA